MTALPVPHRTPVLADALVRSRGIATDAILVIAGVALVSVLAQVTIPLWPVPITGQTLAVLLVGATLGSRRGAVTLALYLAAGVAGVPLFAGFTGGPASILRPDFGYIIGFIASAYVIGWFAERNWDKHVWRALAGFGLASILPFVFGLPFLALILGTMGANNSLPVVLSLGFTPFIVGGICKAAIAAIIIPAAWKSLSRRGDTTGSVL